MNFDSSRLLYSYTGCGPPFYLGPHAVQQQIWEKIRLESNVISALAPFVSRVQILPPSLQNSPTMDGMFFEFTNTYATVS